GLRVRRQPQRPLNHSIRPRSHLLQTLAPNHRVLPNRPPRNLLLYLRRRPPLVHAVIPLAQPVIHHRAIAKARNLARLSRASHRTPYHRAELHARKIIPQHRRPLAPQLRQRNVRPAGVLVLRAPLRLAMPHQPQFRSRSIPHSHSLPVLSNLIPLLGARNRMAESQPQTAPPPPVRAEPWSSTASPSPSRRLTASHPVPS